jgi:hypothetical protein
VATNLSGIQQTLNNIDAMAANGNWQLKFEIMTLMLASVNTIMNELRNETKPKQKTVTKTVTVPKYKDVLRYNNAPGTNSNIKKGVNDAERLQREKDRLNTTRTDNTTTNTTVVN